MSNRLKYYELNEGLRDEMKKCLKYDSLGWKLCSLNLKFGRDLENLESYKKYMIILVEDV